ncbi:MAG: D-alanyl-D-alanine carboxypeptidase family protein [Alphaproteobacteria bacterium]
MRNFAAHGVVFQALLWLLLVTIAPHYAQADIPVPPTTAKRIYLQDLSTGRVLLAKQAYERFQPGPLSLLMTLYVVFDLVEHKNLKMEESLQVSQHVADFTGQEMNLQKEELVTVEDLVKGIAIGQAVDAAMVLEEKMPKIQDSLVNLMTFNLKNMNLKDSQFSSGLGINTPYTYVTASDMAVIAERLINNYPQYYRYFSLKDFDHNLLSFTNKNSLLFFTKDIDGLMAGINGEGEAQAVISAKIGNRRLMLVISGGNDLNKTLQEAKSLIHWGFRNFKNYTLFKPGFNLGDVPIWQGNSSSIYAMIAQNVSATMSGDERQALKATLTIDSPIAAPIEAGQIIGTLNFSSTPEMPIFNIPVKASISVQKQRLIPRALNNLALLLSGQAHFENTP